MNFSQLSEILKETNERLFRRTIKAINVTLTLRNWLFGYYIVEFEQNGEDRAQYGTQLLNTLAGDLAIKGLTAPELSRCRQFYKTYPQLVDLIPREFNSILPKQILGTVSQESEIETGLNLGTLSQDLKQDINTLKYNHLNKLLTNISFSHWVELIKISDEVKRSFYELLILKTQPNIRELRRQIQTLSYERLGFSQNKEIAFEQIQQKITPEFSSDIVKSHYFFDFLHISQPQLIEENELEQALTNHLQEFILELGNGFCFEARQKRILIGDEYFFIDLVFYHRILKCHVLIELKTEEFKHDHIGQLKTYINYYKKNFVLPTDNPPVGILLVTDQNKTLVEYAVADSDIEIFVSKYMIELPNKKQLEAFISSELKNF
ncbi:MAG: PDDEXK nuclease domain-containing protein [Bacteroidota bacterium]|nr:PDDEXK nuclease domain-containing protein [Bacteroidota bacterium]